MLIFRIVASVCAIFSKPSWSDRYPSAFTKNLLYAHLFTVVRRAWNTTQKLKTLVILKAFELYLALFVQSNLLIYDLYTRNVRGNTRFLLEWGFTVLSSQILSISETIYLFKICAHLETRFSFLSSLNNSLAFTPSLSSALDFVLLISASKFCVVCYLPILHFCSLYCPWFTTTFNTYQGSKTATWICRTLVCYVSTCKEETLHFNGSSRKYHRFSKRNTVKVSVNNFIYVQLNQTNTDLAIPYRCLHSNRKW